MNSSSTQVVTRFAPSPTGFLHLGGARTALYCYLFARRHQGRFLLRIEDTDTARSLPEYTQSILDGLSWLGLDPDEPPLFQSSRKALHVSTIHDLVKQGHAYYCTCTKERLEALREGPEGLHRYDRHCRDKNHPKGEEGAYVVRFKSPLSGEETFEDAVRGPITFNWQEFDDFVILRSDGGPTYNLSVVIDDAASSVTHVIRGEDHINNTPKQIAIYRALNAPVPTFAHLPLIHGSDGAKLSKRHGALNLLAYRDLGYLSEGLVNFLLRLGFSHQDQELFTQEEMIEAFSLSSISKSRAIFSADKLLWINHEKLKLKTPKSISNLLSPFLPKDLKAGEPQRLSAIRLFQPRARTLLEYAESLTWVFTKPEIPQELSDKWLTPEGVTRLLKLKKSLEALEDWSEPALSSLIPEFVKSEGLSFAQVGKPLRVALFARENTPELPELLSLLGRDETLSRLGRLS